MVIKRFDVLSVAKMSAIIAAAIGLIAAVLFLLFGGLLGRGGLLGFGGGLLGVIVLPIIYGVFGFIGGLVQAFVYNFAAGFVGGVRIETE